jgi:aspartate/methionine/tyrosine aminotransferase
MDALRRGEVHYVANRGLRDLREALAEDVSRETGRSFDPDHELIVTAGASEALCMATLALLERGQEVVITEPAWNHYAAAVELAGGAPVPLALRAQDGWAIDPDRLSRIVTPRTRMIVVNSPSNPTGAVQTPDVLEAVADIALRNDIYVFTDEIYRHFVYAGKHVSITRYLEGSDLLLYVNSASKSFGMSGWRVGWVAAAAPVSEALNRVHQYLTVCGVPFAQRGLLASLINAGLPYYLRDMRVEFHARAEVWSQALKDVAGVDLVRPSGAFYLFPRIRFRDLDDRALCTHMLEEHGLAMVPGSVFGAGCAGHVRISYGLGMETQRAAATRLAEVLRAG